MIKFPKLIRHEEYDKLKLENAKLNHALIDLGLHKVRLKRFIMLVDTLKEMDNGVRRKEIQKSPYIDLLREYHRILEAFIKSVDDLSKG